VVVHFTKEEEPEYARPSSTVYWVPHAHKMPYRALSLLLARGHA